MNHLMLAIILSVALIGCTDKETSTTQKNIRKQTTADISAGKALTERECKGCHGLNGGGSAPAIPHLAAQRESYLLASLKAYKDGKRSHAALRDMAEHMSEADARNVASVFLEPAAGRSSARCLPFSRPMSGENHSRPNARNVMAKTATARRRERRAWPASNPLFRCGDHEYLNGGARHLADARHVPST